MGIYLAKPTDGDTSWSGLQDAIQRLQQRSADGRNLFYYTAQSCGEDQLGSDVFDKTAAAQCISNRAEGSLRSLMVLLGPSDTDEYYVHIPMGMVVKFEVPFKRLWLGIEREDEMTVIIQL